MPDYEGEERELDILSYPVESLLEMLAESNASIQVAINKRQKIRDVLNQKMDKIGTEFSNLNGNYNTIVHGDVPVDGPAERARF